MRWLHATCDLMSVFSHPSDVHVESGILTLSNLLYELLDWVRSEQGRGPTVYGIDGNMLRASEDKILWQNHPESRKDLHRTSYKCSLLGFISVTVPIVEWWLFPKPPGTRVLNAKAKDRNNLSTWGYCIVSNTSIRFDAYDWGTTNFVAARKMTVCYYDL